MSVSERIDTTMRRIALEASSFASTQYSAKAQVAACFLQSFIRTRSLETARCARAAAKERVRDGVQFAQRTVWGLEGNSHFHVGIVRGKSHAHERCGPG